jgi:1-deoxy-D-xylulose-5-phosphate reductoisomerase
MKRVLILGSTGSIGRQAVEIVTSSDQLVLAGLSVHTSWRDAVVQAESLGSPPVAVTDPGAGEEAASGWDGTLFTGPTAAMDLIAATEPDVVLNGIVGAAGLEPSVVALGAGIDLALANKESLVIGGELLVALAEATGASILPVDSEHSAIAQLMGGEDRAAIERIVLTASGGPFRERMDLSEVTVEEALDHPTWKMGGRITIDSATLMNKGLEMIEAHHLFDVSYDRIEVVVHPQSIVHSLIDLVDGASLAHLGHPDMRVPIAWALSHPDRTRLPVRRLDLTEVGTLDFERPDIERFPCLELARAAGEKGGISPCVMNAADECAVEGFLKGSISFDRIPEIVERVLDDVGEGPARSFDELLAVDEASRERAFELIGGGVPE